MTQMYAAADQTSNAGNEGLEEVLFARKFQEKKEIVSLHSWESVVREEEGIEEEFQDDSYTVYGSRLKTSIFVEEVILNITSKQINLIISQIIELNTVSLRQCNICFI